MFQCPPGLYIAVFDKYGEETKYDPLTRFVLMALARKTPAILGDMTSLMHYKVVRYKI